MIRRAEDRDFETIWAIINDGARAYQGVIPADRWHDPYMPREELREQIEAGVEFCVYEDAGEMLGVMGIQHVDDVTLIRHAYVRTAARSRGIGGLLLQHLRTIAAGPVLIGTWANAVWAIRFYEKHGFRVVPHDEKERLLRRYWSIPERQIATSVVLAEASAAS
jgi:N-acetylglutamate synthase-like GNAT family acetyltransferase